jgi:hypothetical protein
MKMAKFWRCFAADFQIALKAPLAAQAPIKAATVAFAKSSPKHKSRAELLTASTAVQCRCCQRVRAGVTELKLQPKPKPTMLLLLLHASP